MTLTNWAENGWLRPHRASPEELKLLLDTAADDLANARTPGLSPAWSFNIAYAASLTLCTIALAAAGYRADRDSKHYRTIAALPLILGEDVRELADFLDHCRTLRHDATYEGVRSVSRQEADELIETAEELRAILTTRLARVRPT